MASPYIPDYVEYLYVKLKEIKGEIKSALDIWSSVGLLYKLLN